MQRIADDSELPGKLPVRRRRSRAGRAVRWPVRRARRWYRTTSDGDLVLTAVCVLGVIALVVVGVAILLV